LAWACTTITVTATDAATNSATCTTTFTVTDATAPTVICRRPPRRRATNCLAAVPMFWARERNRQLQRTNGITLSQSPAPEPWLAWAMHTITVTATDAATNSATCATTFTVNRRDAPTVICPAPPAPARSYCLAVPDFLGGVSATDSCSGTTGSL